MTEGERKIIREHLDWLDTMCADLEISIADQQEVERLRMLVSDHVATVECEHCHEANDIEDCATSWQQWQCPCCASWNDRAEDSEG